MKPCIPNEEEFETILASLASYETTLSSEVLIKEAMKGISMKDFSEDAEAFKTAFSNPSSKQAPMDAHKVLVQVREVRDRITLLTAKIIDLRNHVRQMSDRDAVNELLG